MNYTKKGTKCWPFSIPPPNPIAHHVGIHLYPHHNITHTLIILLHHIPLPTVSHITIHTLHHIKPHHMSLHLHHIDHIQNHTLHLYLAHHHITIHAKLHTNHLHVNHHLHPHPNPSPVNKIPLMLSLTTPTWMTIPKSSRGCMQLIKLDL